MRRIERKRAQTALEKQQDRHEGEAYRNLAEQYAREQMELERYRKLTQKDVKHMYDKAVDDKRKVKQMEQQMDEVHHFSLIRLYDLLCAFRTKMRNFVYMLKQRRRLLE